MSNDDVVSTNLNARLLAIGRAWLTDLQACVRAVDYARAYPLFAPEVVAFGTHAYVVAGRENVEREQWRNVWPNVREFTFRLAEARCLGDERQLCVVTPWDSLGVDADGTTFSRPGRATVVLVPRDGLYVAIHTHFSLAPART